MSKACFDIVLLSDKMSLMKRLWLAAFAFSLLAIVGTHFSTKIIPSAYAADTCDGKPCDTDPKTHRLIIKCADGEVAVGSPISGSEHCIVDDPSQGGVIVTWAKWILTFLSGLVGITVVFMIVLSGIQYITSAGNPDAAKAARGRLTNAILGLLLFILMVGILNFIIPGHIF